MTVDSAREIEALGWCAALGAKVEFIADSGWTDPEAGGSILVRVEILGFHPVIGRTLAGAVRHLQHQIDARDKVLSERERKLADQRALDAAAVALQARAARARRPS